MTTVRLVALGPLREGLDLARVAKSGNKAQALYHFVLGDPLTVIANPDADEGQYTFEALADRLAVRQVGSAQLLVGVTDHSIYDELFSAVDEDLSCILISTDDIREVIDTDRTTAAGYVLFEIAAELLTVEYRRLTGQKSDPAACELPWHVVRKSCIFDYDSERKHTGEKMLKPDLCDACRSRLRDAGVPPSVEAATLRLARAGLAPVRTAVRRLVLHRWFALVAGFIAGQAGPAYGVAVLAVVGMLMLVVERRA